MAKTLCPCCDKLVGMSSTPQPVGLNDDDAATNRDTFSARRWRLDMHRRELPNGEGVVCDGSGKLI